MRGLLLGLCFAGLLGLTLGTVALRVTNRAERQVLAELEAERLALRLEVERRRVLGLRKETPAVLARRLRMYWEQSGRE